GIRARVPKLRCVVRLSAFDTVPYRKGADGVGEPEENAQGPSDVAQGASNVAQGASNVAQGFSPAYGFGLLEDDDHMDSALAEARDVLRMLERLGVRWICVTAGSPYYNPHVQRPALFPPSDGYLPPEDPLAGVARQIAATARLKAAYPTMVFV